MVTITSNPGALPRISLRLTGCQLSLLREGLLRLVTVCVRVRAGKYPNATLLHPALRDESPTEGCFDAELGEHIVKLWGRLYAALRGQCRCRVQLDVVELWACSLATRAESRLRRHGHVESQSQRPSLVRSRLLRLVEKARRRAAQAAIRTLGRPGYELVVNRWGKFAQWLRFWGLGCPCETPQHAWLRRYHKQIIDDAVRVAARALSVQGRSLPDLDLRPIVRKAVAQVRRGRKGWSIKTLLSRPEGAEYLLNFVTNHKPKPCIGG